MLSSRQFLAGFTVLERSRGGPTYFGENHRQLASYASHFIGCTVILDLMP
jgi:hypothetical protein